MFGAPAECFLTFQAPEIHKWTRQTSLNFLKKFKIQTYIHHHFNHHKVYSLVARSTLMMCNHYHYPVQEHFLTQKWDSPTIRQPLPLCSSPHPLATTSLVSDSMGLATLDISCTRNDAICGFLWLVFFTECMFLQVIHAVAYVSPRFLFTAE